jgi:hypothetical protein
MDHPSLSCSGSPATCQSMACTLNSCLFLSWRWTRCGSHPNRAWCSASMILATFEKVTWDAAVPPRGPRSARAAPQQLPPRSRTVPFRPSAKAIIKIIRHKLLHTVTQVTRGGICCERCRRERCCQGVNSSQLSARSDMACYGGATVSDSREGGSTMTRRPPGCRRSGAVFAGLQILGCEINPSLRPDLQASPCFHRVGEGVNA